MISTRYKPRRRSRKGEKGRESRPTFRWMEVRLHLEQLVLTAAVWYHIESYDISDETMYRHVYYTSTNTTSSSLLRIII